MDSSGHQQTPANLPPSTLPSSCSSEMAKRGLQESSISGAPNEASSSDARTRKRIQLKSPKSSANSSTGMSDSGQSVGRPSGSELDGGKKMGKWSEKLDMIECPTTAQQSVQIVAKLESNSVVNVVNSPDNPDPRSSERHGFPLGFGKSGLSKLALLLINSSFIALIIICLLIFWFIKENLTKQMVVDDNSDQQCVPLKVAYCIKHNVRYSYITLPNDANESTQQLISNQLADYDPILSVNCYSLLPLFLCSIHTPFCNDNHQPIKPCKSFCKEAVRRCDFFLKVFSLEWPSPVDCDQYPEDPDPFVCVGFRDNERITRRNRICNSDGFRCDASRCLPRTWSCDGFLDCNDGSDEGNCSSCEHHELYCGDGKCVDKKDICDGVRDCPDSRDERNCLRLAQSMGRSGRGRLEAWSAVDNSWNTVCGENWDSKFMSTKACKMLGYKRVEDTQMRSESLPVDRMGQSVSKTMFYKGREKGCKNGSGLSVYLKCGHFQCGRSAVSMSSNFRIVGGSESKPGQWPWLAGLHGGQAEIFFCGGILISQRWVLSAAHCVGNQTDFSELTIKLGLTRRTSSPLFVRRHRVANVIKHPAFNIASAYSNDIALLLLNESVEFDEFLRPVCLPTGSEELRPNFKCTVIGWGKSQHDKEADYLNVVHEVNVPLVNHSVCAEWYQLQDISIGERMLCAGYPEGKKDACQGDSGGPLLCRNADDAWYVAGIVSWGINCAQPELPGIYTNVIMYRDWIDVVTQEHGYPLLDAEAYIISMVYYENGTRVDIFIVFPRKITLPAMTICLGLIPDRNVLRRNLINDSKLNDRDVLRHHSYLPMREVASVPPVDVQIMCRAPTLRPDPLKGGDLCENYAEPLVTLQYNYVSDEIRKCFTYFYRERDGPLIETKVGVEKSIYQIDLVSKQNYEIAINLHNSNEILHYLEADTFHLNTSRVSEFAISVSRISTKMLPSPYRTDCVDYKNAFMGRTGCIQSCRLKWPLTNCSVWSKFVPAPIHSNFSFNIINEICQLPERDTCHSTKTCRNPCENRWYTTTRIWSESRRDKSKLTRIYVRSDFNQGLEIVYLFEPYLNLIEYLCYIASVIGIWLGVAFSDLIRICLQFIGNKMQTGNKPPASGKAIPPPFAIFKQGQSAT